MFYSDCIKIKAENKSSCININVYMHIFMLRNLIDSVKHILLLNKIIYKIIISLVCFIKVNNLENSQTKIHVTW